jgi:comEA protein
MFNLEKREIFIILFLLMLLIVGLCFGFYQKRAPSVKVEVNSFSPDSGVEWQQKKININEADVRSLKALGGIGESLAKRIVEYREKNGYFRSIEELKKVKGIGKKLFSRIKDKLAIE